MNNLKHYLTNLHFQTNLLISFFLENESLLSPDLISLMDKSQIELRDLLKIKTEIVQKLSLFDSIQTVCEHPRYFMTDHPLELIQFYSAQSEFKTLSPELTTFLNHAISFAQAMHKSNLEVIENLPPLYQSIINHSRKNRREGFREVLSKIVYEHPYPEILTAECIRITTLIADLAKSKTALNFILTSLDHEF
ncbi:hypothetical protein [Marinifilum flexuosum]|uniref:hypothetical protein n=1 Tax=Marinifilum flexuosum TaxID=1117708 RepID=UPI0024955BE5|nr:hypothetical protein [Marinifilum flexuosum]